MNLQFAALPNPVLCSKAEIILHSNGSVGSVSRTRNTNKKLPLWTVGRTATDRTVSGNVI